MNAIILFTIATVVNVTLCTIRAICTIKSDKWVSALTNAICYGFYPLIVMLTAKGTVGIIVNMIITAIVNFVCVWIIKYVEEKSRKDKLWKVEVAVPKLHYKSLDFDLRTVPHNYTKVGEYVMFNFYCNTQADTKKVIEISKQYNGKLSAYESKPLI